MMLNDMRKWNEQKLIGMSHNGAIFKSAKCIKCN